MIAKLSEHAEQVALFRWIKLHSARYPDLAKAFAIPNGGHRHIAVAAKLKAEGVRKGIPDIFLPVPSQGYHGLWIELKTGNNGVSVHQKARLTDLNADGYRAVVCRGWEAAADEMMDYLGVNDD